MDKENKSEAGCPEVSEREIQQGDLQGVSDRIAETVTNFPQQAFPCTGDHENLTNGDKGIALERLWNGSESASSTSIKESATKLALPSSSTSTSTIENSFSTATTQTDEDERENTAEIAEASIQENRMVARPAEGRGLEESRFESAQESVSESGELRTVDTVENEAENEEPDEPESEVRADPEPQEFGEESGQEFVEESVRAAATNVPEESESVESESGEVQTVDTADHQEPDEPESVEEEVESMQTVEESNPDDSAPATRSARFMGGIKTIYSWTLRKLVPAAAAAGIIIAINHYCYNEIDNEEKEAAWSPAAWSPRIFSGYSPEISRHETILAGFREFRAMLRESRE